MLQVFFYVNYFVYVLQKKNQEKSRHNQEPHLQFLGSIGGSCCSPHKWVPKLATNSFSSFETYFKQPVIGFSGCVKK